MPRDSKSRFTAAVEIQVVDNSTSWIRRIARSFGEITKAGKQASKSFELSANMKQAAENVTGFANDMAAAVSKPIKTFTAFEEQMSSVKAATFDLTKSMSPKEIDEMNTAVADLATEARRLGAATKYSATEAAAGMDILAKNFSGSDLQKSQDIVAAMPGILNTAAATRESIETTSDIATAAMNQFGLAAKDMTFIGDVLVKGANSSAISLVDLGESLKYSGVTAKAAGVDLATTTAMIGALGNAGKKGSTAGTGLASVLGNIQSGAQKQKSALAALGINVADKQGNLKPIVDLLAELDKAADKKFGKGKGGVRRDRWLQGLVGMGGDKEALAILMQQAGAGELQKLVAANKEAAGTAAKVAAEMNNNTTGAAKELDSTLEELQLTIGQELIPMVVDLIKWAKEVTSDFTSWAKTNPGLVTGITSLVAGLATVGLVVGPVIKGIAVMTTVWGGLTGAVAMFQRTALLLTGGRGLFAGISAGITMLRGVTLASLRAMTVAMLTNPVTLIITAIATAALLVYEYWDPLKEFFSGLWSSVTETFQAALDWIVAKLEWVMDKIDVVRDAVNAVVGDDRGTAVAGARSIVQHHILQLGQPEVAAMQTSAGMVGEAARGRSFADLVANDALYSLEAVKANLANWMPQGAANGPVAQGPALLSPDQSSTSNFSGDLKITVDSEGKVVKTEMRSNGDPNFAVRMNAGGQ
jgi:TP901 family phage tail tape measure protein